MFSTMTCIKYDYWGETHEVPEVGDEWHPVHVVTDWGGPVASLGWDIVFYTKTKEKLLIFSSRVGTSDEWKVVAVLRESSVGFLVETLVRGFMR